MMSPFFLALVGLVAASVLLSAAAAARSLWLHLQKRSAPAPGAGSDSLLLLAVAASWYSVAAGWAGQLVCYPIYADMSALGPQAFHAYSNGYLSRWASGTWPVGMMCLSWALLLWMPARNVPTRLVWSIVGLCIAFAVVTPPAAIAQSRMFEEGFSSAHYDRLMLWNAVRTAIFSGIGVLALVAMHRRLMFTDPRSD
jgi:hypothetical protein